jgi:hypothetical protein
VLAFFGLAIHVGTGPARRSGTVKCLCHVRDALAELRLVVAEILPEFLALFTPQRSGCTSAEGL